ncbi:U3 small nucleolar RNA-associated protein 25 [Diplonema papillatum]|nr:U3 small nucleolar RNA-associated protein 25 [Diplonema papillatum]
MGGRGKGKGGKGGRPGKGGKWTGGGTKGGGRKKKTREEKVARDNARLDKVLEKKRKRDDDAVSSSSEEPMTDALRADEQGYAALLQSFGVTRPNPADDLDNLPDEEEVEEIEELEESEEGDDDDDLGSELDEEEMAKLSPEERELLKQLETEVKQSGRNRGQPPSDSEEDEEEDDRQGEPAAPSESTESGDEGSDDEEEVFEPLDPVLHTAAFLAHFEKGAAAEGGGAARPAKKQKTAAALPSSQGGWPDLAPHATFAARADAADLQALQARATAGAVPGNFLAASCLAPGPEPAAAAAALPEKQRCFGRAYLASLESYADVLFPLRTWENAPAVVDAHLLHALAHLLRNTHTVSAHNRMIKKKKLDASEADDDTFRDQGYQRPTVLVLLPYRNVCLQYVESLVRITGCSDVTNWERFVEDFSEFEQEKDPKFHRRTQDYKQQFSGNINDKFCFGVAVNFDKKQKPGAAAAAGEAPLPRAVKQVQIFSSFAKSDIIFASPLGLSTVLAKNKKQGNDFLASIEVLYLDQLEVMALQNFHWVEESVAAVNQLPMDIQTCADIYRIKQRLLDGEGAVVRQTIAVSRANAAEFNALMTNGCKNRSGLLKLGRSFNGELTRVVNEARHLFHRLDVSSVAKSPDERFEYFEKRIFSRLISGMNSNIGTMSTIVFIPSYFDYTRVRNFFESVDRDSFCELCEYTPVKEMHHAIKEFTSKKRSFLLMTERFYFFRRFFISGVKSIIFYQLPQCPWFYHELVNNITDEITPSVLTLYSRLDMHQLVRVLGTERAKRVLTSDNPTHMFC